MFLVWKIGKDGLSLPDMYNKSCLSYISDKWLIFEHVLYVHTHIPLLFFRLLEQESDLE